MFGWLFKKCVFKSSTPPVKSVNDSNCHRQITLGTEHKTEKHGMKDVMLFGMNH